MFTHSIGGEPLRGRWVMGENPWVWENACWVGVAKHADVITIMNSCSRKSVQIVHSGKGIWSLWPQHHGHSILTTIVTHLFNSCEVHHVYIC